MNLYRRIRKAVARQMTLPGRVEQIQEALGRIESRQQAGELGRNPRDYEFRVYSQWGEDGIIDHLVSNALIANRSFVEFGVESYTEANTLFLLKHRQWRGLVIDGSPQHIETIRRSETFWKYDLYADCSFITKDNINEIILRNGFSGDLGILSVDIDGNDYWVWDAITAVSPRIVISEYNSLFGPTAKVSIPYQADFYRQADKAPRGYFGASIAALDHLAREKGYSLVAGNSAGNNVFFVRNDCLGSLQAVSPEAAYVQAAFREDRSPAGEVDLLQFAQRRNAIGRFPVINVTTGQQMLISELSRSALQT
jgi:hypothetical protein